MSQFGFRPSDERACPFFVYLETSTVLPQPEYFLSVFVIGPPAVWKAFCFLYKCCYIVNCPSQVLGHHEL